MRYVALIQKNRDSCYGVIIPDVPGCFSAGDTLDEAIRNAAEALALHLEDEAELPAPRSADEIMAEPDLVEEREGALLVAVPFVKDRGSTTRVNISLDRGLLEAIDDAAKNRRMTRSAFLASAARNEIANG